MTHEDLKTRHFERLNSYHHSVEYAEYARAMGAEVPQGDLPTLIGKRWEIDAEIYREFLAMLPPLGWSADAFYLSEFSFDDITAKFTKEGDKYYCEFARFQPKQSLAVQTPWGPAQTSKVIAPGIVWHETSSHGGFFLSPERIAEMPQPLRDFSPWAGSNWYEEDCDWSVVALAFPQYFSGEDVRHALATLKNYKPELYEAISPSFALRVKQAPSEGREL